ncbi:hypothetical protein [Kitasatospora kifunensis]|uniref:Uncharacterized protein n=1 Tax=Kitasatospora kifunensis TaxID=58351 RepID=A0A7W7VZ73_KITKI|nr:hypothetical protein [Kitasatospora kifunensis]MBB4928482.1 hypothetical protein [Kitasatospora kifunensis]
MLIDKDFRAILKNGRRGPEAIVIQRSAASSPLSPAAPWTGFTVATYLDVRYPTQTENQYELEIRDFFKVHPLFVVRAFDNHERAFPFPAAHCANDHDDGDREDGDRGDHALPHDGAAADGSSPSASPSPQEGTPSPNGQSTPQALGSEDTIHPLASRDAAADRSTGLLSAKHIGIAACGLLAVLGMLATAWLRRRRSAA